MSKTVIQMDQVTQGNAAQIEDLSSSAQSMASQADQSDAPPGPHHAFLDVTRPWRRAGTQSS